MRIALVAGLLMALSFSVWAQSPAKAPTAEESIEVVDPTVRVPLPGKDNTSAYFLLRNTGDQPHELVGAQVAFAQRAEIHNHTTEDGMMRMRKEDSVTIPAGGELRFSSGGYHLMIFDIDRRPRTGDPMELVLEFADGSKKAITASAVSVFDRPHH